MVRRVVHGPPFYSMGQPLVLGQRLNSMRGSRAEALDGVLIAAATCPKVRMIHFLRRAAIAVVALSALLLSAVPAAHADEVDVDGDITWMVRPSDGTGEDGRSWIELELDPGETIDEHLLVRNLSPSTVTFRLSAADGYFTDTGRFNMLTSDRESVDAGTWIDIQDTVEVPSGGDVIVPFTVTVPDNATPGDHPAGVAAGIRSGSDDEVGIESRVGFRVMTRVTGELTPSLAAEISGSYEGAWNPFDAGRLHVAYAVENTGNTRLAVAPQITVSALFGLVSFTAAGEPIVEIAPGESRSATVSFPSAWPLFLYSADVVAAATAVTDELAPGDVVPVEASSPVVAMPWPQLVALAIALLLLWLLWRDRRRRERLIEGRVEQARQEERDAAANALPLRRARVTVGFVATVIAFGFAVGGAASATAAPDPDDSPGVTIHVEIDPAPAPTASPTSERTPIDGGAGSLPNTGAPDVTSLVVGGLAVIGIGTAAYLVHRAAGVHRRR